MAIGVMDLVFLFGCGGLLRNACEPAAIEERLVIRADLRGIVTAAVIATCLPRNRIGKLSGLILFRAWEGATRGVSPPIARAILRGSHALEADARSRG
ncbi:MAG: hypothetical protein NVS2B11_01660 [Acetobacteraceae bacterium]